ncbi:DUF4232 domain-containing protein [Streptomyces fagopyri]|uniref:DUF4232 domain-containing protein n=1 Tax=Streptomyces fagopyri TaxID=2662397 RepID=UPI0037F1A624
MSARTVRTRLLAASTVALAALALTGCDNGKGVRDEGPSAASESSAKPGGSTTAKPAGDNGTTAGGSTGGTAGGTAATPTKGSTNGSSGKAGDGRSAGGGTGSSRNAACDGADTRTTATEVSRPLNHLLLTVTNTGSKNCDLTGYPIARFGEAQSVPPVAEETHPQAVVTLAPGESGYAGVLLSAGDGSGGNGYTAKTLVIGFAKGATSTPALPAKGVHVDDRLTVTYWQQSLDDALSY